MGLYNFRERFAPFILSGEKTHTIRAVRANPDKPGNILYLYTGLRTKKAKRLMCVRCVKIETITIHDFSPTELFRRWHSRSPTVEIDGHGLDPSEMVALAKRDGFGDFTEMMSFWEGRLPFHGHIIHWQRIS